MRRLARALLAAALLAAAPATAAQEAPSEPGTCLSGAELELGRLVNDHRRANGLAPIPLSRSLSLAAKWHAIDLQDHDAATGTDARGQPCGLHSWSAKGPWSPVCYTPDHQAAREMWRKPKELTGGSYPGLGFENVYFTSLSASPQQALAYWKGRPDENAMLLEKGAWRRGRWPAMGIGIYRQYAVLWVGDAKDPLGPIGACEGASPSTADNRDPAARPAP